MILIYSYHGVYFFGDFSRKWIKYLSFDGNNHLLNTKTDVYSNVGATMFEANAGNVIGFEQGLDGAMWYHTWSGIFRITSSGGGGVLTTSTSFTTTTSTTTTTALTPAMCNRNPIAISINWIAGTDINFDRSVCEGDSITWVWADGREFFQLSSFFFFGSPLP